jgi:hypothetical protein
MFASTDRSLPDTDTARYQLRVQEIGRQRVAQQHRNRTFLRASCHCSNESGPPSQSSPVAPLRAVTLHKLLQGCQRPPGLPPYDAIMRCKLGSPLLIAIALQAPLALSETDWNAVRNLSAETPIAVSLKHTRGLHHCWFQSATQDALTCDRDDQDPHRMICRRDQIRKIYRTPEPRLERSSTPPFGVGGAVVASIPILIILRNGAAAGAAAGLVGTALIVRHFNHGQLVYRSPPAHDPGTGVANATRR